MYMKQRVPIITIILALANIIVFAVLTIQGDTENAQFMFEHGASFGPAVFEDHEFWRLVTCLFLHFGTEHIINNIFSLAIVGSQLEQMLGSRLYIAIYFLTGVGANLISTFYYFSKGEMIVSAGASTAIYGLVGAFIVVLLKNRRMGGRNLFIRIILLVAVIIYTGYQSGTTDITGHLMGLILGLVLGLILIPRGKRE